MTVHRYCLTFLCFFVLASTSRAQQSFDVGGDLRDMVDQYLTEIAREQWKQRDATLAAIDEPAEVRARQAYIREKFLEALGGFPEKTPLNARITGKFEREGYRVEKLVFESLPGFHVTANVYVPARGEAPYPAVLGVAGHSANGKASDLYQRAWISMAKRGFLVLAYDPPGQGERSLYFDPALGKSRVGIGTREHSMAGIQCLLTGTHFARYELWDGVRAVDYLLTRPDVDPKRLAVAGNSGGGTQAAYLAVAEPRLAAAISSCYMTSWKQLWFDPGPQDAEQNFVDFLKNGFDFSDFAIAFAPKPFKILAAVQDFFPIAGARSAYEEVRRIYGVLGQSEGAGFFEYDDRHGWSKPRREATYRWLERWFHDREEEGAELEFEVEPEANLLVTPTGQVATSYEAETVQSLNQKLAETIVPRRKAAEIQSIERLRGLVADRLRIPREVIERRQGPSVTEHGELNREGYRIEKIVLKTEKAIQAPALVFVPEMGGPKKPAILYVHGDGKAADAHPGGDIEALVRAGQLVLAPDPRGWGESGLAARPQGYNPMWRTAQRALLVGKTLPGMQVQDLLGAFDYLASRDDVDASRIGVLGKGHGGVLALFVAFLEPRIAKAAAEGAVLSYMAVVRAPLHRRLMSIVIPGVLRDFDLPDLAARMAPRPLRIAGPQSPTGAPVPQPDALKEYAMAAEAYKNSGEPGRFQIAAKPQEGRFEESYGDWIRLW